MRVVNYTLVGFVCFCPAQNEHSLLVMIYGIINLEMYKSGDRITAAVFTRKTQTPEQLTNSLKTDLQRQRPVRCSKFDLEQNYTTALRHLSITSHLLIKSIADLKCSNID